MCDLQNRILDSLIFYPLHYPVTPIAYDKADDYYQLSIKLLKGYNMYYPISFELPAIINYENLYLDEQISDPQIASKEFDDEVHRRNEIVLGDLYQEYAEIYTKPPCQNLNIAFDYYSAALTCYENYQHLAGQNRLSDCINQILHLENLTDKRYKTYSLFSGEEVPNIVHKELQK